MIGFFMKSFLRFIVLLSMAMPSVLWAQKTKVSGTVMDKISKEPLPFVNLVFKGNGIGATTDTAGIFRMETEQGADSLIVSLVGYKKQTLFIKRNQSQRIDILLEEDNYNLHEIVIKPGRNPAFRILDQLVEHKKENRTERFPTYSWEEYEKFQIYFGNYSKKFTDRKQFSNYKFIFDYADSTSDGRALLPIYMSETVKQKLVCDSLNINKEIIVADKHTGETYEQLTTIANRMVENVNVYDNFFLILDKSFISPANDNYQLYYKYYLEDSTQQDGRKIYRIRFVPKWKEDLAFSGQLYIAEGSWAIQKIELKINNEINLNYVKDFWVVQEYAPVQGRWIQKKFETSATISPIKRKQSEEFTVHRSTSYRNIRYNDPTAVQAGLNDPALKNINPNRTESYWSESRPDSLNSKEKYSYLIADTINYVPAIKKLKKAAITVASGYIELGPISIGQIHTFYSFNPIEQDRYKLGAKTNKYFSKKLQLEGYLAYGSSDLTYKYKAAALYVPVKNDHRLSIGASYLYDLAQMGVSENHIQHDNILTSLTKTSTANRLTFHSEYNLFAEKYWNKTISNRLSITSAEIRPLGDLKFDRLIDSSSNLIQHYSRIYSTEIHLRTRLAFQEETIESEFKRSSISSPYPILLLDLAICPKGFLLSNYDYQKVQLNVKGKLRLNPIGYTQYNLELGKTFGHAPYLFTELHPGNQTLVYDMEAFNMMKYFEFASDQYASLFLDHHFEGFFLNKIPLIKKAQLREVISARAVVGSMSENTKKEMILPQGMKELTDPYLECSVGLENIFKVVRIDYIWRVTQKSPINTENWSIKAKFFFTF